MIYNLLKVERIVYKDRRGIEKYKYISNQRIRIGKKLKNWDRLTYDKKITVVTKLSKCNFDDKNEVLCFVAKKTIENYGWNTYSIGIINMINEIIENLRLWV